MIQYVRACIIVLTLLFVPVAFPSVTFAGDQHPAGETKGSESKVTKQRLAEIRHFAEEAQHVIEFDDNDQVADSLLQTAIEIAESTYDNRVILESYLQFLNMRDVDFRPAKIRDIIADTKDMLYLFENDELLFKAQSAICNAYIGIGDAENSLTHSMKLISMANISGEPDRKAVAYQIAGHALEISDKKEDAFENYLLSAEAISQVHGPQQLHLQEELDDRLFEFYMRINQFEKAAEHKIKQMEAIKHHAETDSIALMWMEVDLCRLKLVENKTIDLKPKLEEIIAFSEDNGLVRMFNRTLSIYRSILLNTQDLAGFRELFVERYPENLEEMKEEFPPLYYIIQAYLMEGAGDINAASHNFHMAEMEVEMMNNDVYSANFYKRYGQYLLRIGEQDKALEKFLMSYGKANNTDYLNFMLDASSYIDSLAYISEDYELAYRFSRIHNDLQNRKTMALHEDDMLKLELKSQERQMTYLANQKQIEKRRKDNLQYTIIVICILSLFVLLILASSLTVPEWLIEMLGFMSILFLFEFIILVLDHKIHHLTHGSLLHIFLIKIAILTFLFPLHHIIETRITDYMKKNKMIGSVNFRAIGRAIIGILPWMREKDGSGGH